MQQCKLAAALSLLGLVETCCNKFYKPGLLSYLRDKEKNHTMQKSLNVSVANVDICTICSRTSRVPHFHCFVLFRIYNFLI